MEEISCLEFLELFFDFFFLKFCFRKHGIFLLAFQFVNAVEEMELAILGPTEPSGHVAI